MIKLVGITILLLFKWQVVLTAKKAQNYLYNGTDTMQQMQKKELYV